MGCDSPLLRFVLPFKLGGRLRTAKKISGGQCNSNVTANKYDRQDERSAHEMLDEPRSGSGSESGPIKARAGFRAEGISDL